MGPRVIGTIAAIACVFLAWGTPAAPTAASSVWDRTYKHQSWGGSWPCPDPQHDVVVASGRFSLPWDVKLLDAETWVNVGHIDGTVRASGMTEGVTATLASPLPRRVLAALAQGDESPATLAKKVFEVKFSGDARRPREIELTAEDGDCTARWSEDRRAALASAPTGSVDCTTGADAVAMWSKQRAYRSGELARVATPGQPTRLYRCIDACAAGTVPVSTSSGTRDDDEDDDVVQAASGDAWAFVAECRGEVTPEAKLPATGSPKWDTSYGVRSEASSDWRCPTKLAVVVSSGRFAIPWTLHVTSGYSGDTPEDVTVATIEGVVAADGTTTLRTKFVVDTLSPEIAKALRMTAAAAMASLRTAVPTLQFILEGGKMNAAGQGRRAELHVGKGCEATLEGRDFKPQQFREEDGWRVDCNSDQGWDPKATYRSGDLATVGTASSRHQYRCSQSACDGRPGSSAQWSKVGRCR